MTKPSPPLWATGRKSRNVWRWSPGSTAWRCALWTNSRAPKKATVTPGLWKIPRADRNVKASDEPELQFHQPDESITGATVIADARVATPEQILASDELLRLIASALRDLGSGPREAFILHAVEGFSVDEIVAITGLPAETSTRLRFCRARPLTQSARTGQAVSRAGSLRPAPLNPILIFGEIIHDYYSRTNPRTS